MTKRTLLPLAIGLSVLLVGLLRIDARVLALSVPPILFGCLEILGCLVGASPPWSAKRMLSHHRVEEGDEVAVTVSVEGPLTPGRLRRGISVVDPFPPAAEWVDGENRSLEQLPADPSIRLSYRIKLARGMHTFSSVQVLEWSLGGLMLRQHSVPVTSHVTATPRAEALGRLQIRPRRTRAFAGPVQARIGGQGLDFHGCRSYVSGDDTRRINWRAYARTGALVINEYEQERVADVNLIVDARQHTQVQLGSRTTFDHSVRAAASLARHFLAVGNLVGLLVYGTARWVYPGAGIRQERRILDMLSAACPAELAAFEDLRNVPTRRLPAQSQLVFVSPLTHTNDAEVISLLVDHGYAVLCICPNAETWERAYLGSHPSFDLAVRIAELSRRERLRMLSRTGAQCIDWDVTEPLHVALASTFGPTSLRRSPR